jgi:hypothetical protein
MQEAGGRHAGQPHDLGGNHDHKSGRAAYGWLPRPPTQRPGVVPRSVIHYCLKVCINSCVAALLTVSEVSSWRVSYVESS